MTYISEFDNKYTNINWINIDDKNCIKEKYIVYVMVFPNGKVYVGKTNNFIRRMYRHKMNAFKYYSKYAVHCAMRKYKGKYDIRVIGIYDTEKEAYEQERGWVSYFDSFHKGYNMTPGGNGVGSGLDNPNANQPEYYEDNARSIKEIRAYFDRMGDLLYINDYCLVYANAQDSSKSNLFYLVDESKGEEYIKTKYGADAEYFENIKEAKEWGIKKLSESVSKALSGEREVVENERNVREQISEVKERVEILQELLEEVE